MTKPTYYIYNPKDDFILPDKKLYYNEIIYQDYFHDLYFQKMGWVKKYGKKVDYSNYDKFSKIQRSPTDLVLKVSNKGWLYSHTIDKTYFLPSLVFTLKEFFSGKVNLKDIKNGTLFFLKKVSDLTYGGYDVEPIIMSKNVYKDITFAIKNMNSIKKYKSNIFAIQLGVQTPKLYYGKKFDTRSYGLVVFDGSAYKGYFFWKYMLRKSSKKYDEYSTDKKTQLTNTTLNFTSFNTIKQKGKLINFFSMHQRKIMWKKQFDIFKDIFNTFFKNYKENKKCYFTLGLDIIFDKSNNPYLLEINKYPALYYDEERIKHLHKNMEYSFFSNEYFDITINNKIVKPEFWIPV